MTNLSSANPNPSSTATGQQLTNILLNEKNFLPWSRAITVALGGRSKLGHINGQIKAPPERDAKFDEWQANDSLVMSWIFNSMESQVYEIFAYSPTALILWESLNKMYGQAHNASRVFELQQEIANSKGEPSQSFTNHLGNMKRRWDELCLYRPATQNVANYIRREEQDRVF